MTGCPVGPSYAFSLPLPEGMTSNFAFMALREIDEYGSRGVGVEGYRPFSVFNSGAKDGNVLIQCEPQDEAQLRELLPGYLSGKFKRAKRRMMDTMDL
jgi:hypothetical protein